MSEGGILSSHSVTFLTTPRVLQHFDCDKKGGKILKGEDLVKVFIGLQDEQVCLFPCGKKQGINLLNKYFKTGKWEKILFIEIDGQTPHNI